MTQWGQIIFEVILSLTNPESTNPESTNRESTNPEFTNPESTNTLSTNSELEFDYIFSFVIVHNRVKLSVLWSFPK